MKDYQRLTEEHIPDAEFCSGYCLAKFAELEEKIESSEL